MLEQVLLDNKVSIIRGISFDYPNKTELFRPSIPYPEYCLNDISEKTNKVYDAIRTALTSLGLDAEHFGKKQWNPLSKYIRPGDTVVLKPNMVLDANRIIDNGTKCLITHPSVVAAILDYCIVAGGKDSRYVIGDAPLHDCKFETLIEEQGYLSLIDFYRDKGYTVSLADFRRSKIDKANDDLRIPQASKITGEGILVDVGEKSSFSNCSYERLQRLRVTDYDPRTMGKHHQPGKHEYMVAKEILEADVIINLPKPKTHRKAGITGALKNMVGVCTNKEYLPHHTLGCREDGGDDFLRRNFYLERAESYLDLRNIYNEEGKIDQAIRMNQDFIKAFRKGSATECYFEGSWYGNDTIWRTVADLNYIVKYADRNGKLQSAPQRKMFTIADMIIAGHKEGPLAPEPLPFGVLVAGEDSLLIDRTIASLMGFDYQAIPQLVDGIGVGRQTTPRIISNDKMLQGADLSKILQLSNRAFIPTLGWQKVLGHSIIEEIKENFIPWSMFLDDSFLVVDKKLYIFGAGARGKQILSILRKHHIHVESFVDNDVNRYKNDFLEKFSCIPLEKAGVGSVFVIAVTLQSDVLQIARQIKIWDDGAYIVIPEIESMANLQD